MHIKCLPRGTGSTRAAVDYLLGERDAMRREREGVEILREDPDMVPAVADSLGFEHKYRSVVIAWAPEDRPTDAAGQRRPRRVREDGLGRTGRRTLLVDGGPAPRTGWRRTRAHPDRPLRPGDGPQPEHRTALSSRARRRTSRASSRPSGRRGSCSTWCCSAATASS